ncbi:arsenical pump-driving ATPase [Heliobacterium undosum]|uniref:Arsenical pump-driving ATPase n=1 Tax=Heliomicrobium undosum TaxID=121734 RepID=A0A845L0V8_9FIRM|nr:arsenical pump-driving ATPase [Heliomicrobium undosum]MZP29226.1 arsenical pump-driving ATPase [Heliomicrobium undosum]
MKRFFEPSSVVTTRYLFFTGKGGVGKTSISCATAVHLADSGKKVLLVSTDPASNLQDVFGMEIENRPTAIPQVKGLFAINLDPVEAARQYRETVIAPYRGVMPEAVLQGIEEQLSGACTVEIAAFDQFAKLIAQPDLTEEYDHILFDTAPTGHTLRLLQLPQAWTDFLKDNMHGGSCLGPLSGLADNQRLYAATLENMTDPAQTKLALVTRPERTALLEAARASEELAALGIAHQHLIINGRFDSDGQDPWAQALRARQQQAIEGMPERLKGLPADSVPLMPFGLTGIENLRRMTGGEIALSGDASLASPEAPALPPLSAVVDSIAAKGNGVVLTMGKGGVGKTTMAAAIAVGLVERGYSVHLTTTDPAAHLSHVLNDPMDGAKWKVSRIDPAAETETYRREILEQAAQSMAADELDFLEEDLNSPCTEEIAVFRAFARVVDDSKFDFIVLDTAPTGHTLLLLDAAQVYHREVERTHGEVPESVRRLLPKLRDSQFTHVVLVTLAEATPVLEAQRLQADLRRAAITPSWWVINQSWSHVPTTDPSLRGRAQAEQAWIEQVQTLAERTAMVSWQAEEPVGSRQLQALLR